MWLIPTRNRPQAMRDLIAAMQATGEIPVCAVMQDGDAYDMEWPAHWHIHCSKEHLEMQLSLNVLFSLHPSERNYGVLTDQSRPETALWASRMEEVASTRLIAMSNSTKERFNPRTGLRRVTAYCMGGDLARDLGWVWPSFCVHLFGDDGIEDIGYELNLMRYLPDVIIRAMQQRDGEVRLDDNHRRLWRGVKYPLLDESAYKAWRRDKFDSLIKSLSKYRCSLSAAS